MKSRAGYLIPGWECRQSRHSSRGYPIPPGYSARNRRSRAEIPPVSRPFSAGRGVFSANELPKKQIDSVFWKNGHAKRNTFFQKRRKRLLCLQSEPAYSILSDNYTAVIRFNIRWPNQNRRKMYGKTNLPDLPQVHPQI